MIALLGRALGDFSTIATTTAASFATTWSSGVSIPVAFVVIIVAVCIVAATLLLSMLKKRVNAQMAEIQKAREELRRTENDLNIMRIEKEELRRTENDLNVMRIEKEEIEISILALRAEVSDLKLQSARIKSENPTPVGHQGKGGKVVQWATWITNAIAGPSRVTSRQFSPSPLNFQQAEEGPSNVVPPGHTGHWSNQDHSDFKLAVQMQREFDKEVLRPSEQRQELVKNIQHLFECAICMEEQPEDYVARPDPCGHKFCRDCIRSHIGSKLAERRFPILCPVCMAGGDKSHSGIVTNALVQQIGITEQQYETWVELEMAEFSVPLCCFKCKRSFHVDRQDLECTDTISCPLRGCNHVWCKLCQQSISRDGPKHSCDGLSELDHLMKQRGWKHCPSCKTPIEKNTGCNHMTCISPGCNTHFCYICGGNIIKSAFARDMSAAIDVHFRSCRLHS